MNNTGFEIRPPQDRAIAAWLILLITPFTILYPYDQYKLYSMLQWLLNGPFLFTFLLIIAFRQSFDWFNRRLFLTAAIVLFSLSFFPMKSWTYYGGALLLTAAGFYLNRGRPDSPERPGKKSAYLSWGLIISGAVIIVLGQVVFVIINGGLEQMDEGPVWPVIGWDLITWLALSLTPYLMLAAFELFACRIKVTRLVTIILAFIYLLIALLALGEGLTSNRRDYGIYIFFIAIFNLHLVWILWAALWAEIAVQLLMCPKPLALWSYLPATLALYFCILGWVWFGLSPEPFVYGNWRMWFNFKLIISFTAILGYSLCWFVRSKIWGDAEVRKE